MPIINVTTFTGRYDTADSHCHQLPGKPHLVRVTAVDIAPRERSGPPDGPPLNADDP